MNYKARNVRACKEYCRTTNQHTPSKNCWNNFSRQFTSWHVSCSNSDAWCHSRV